MGKPKDPGYWRAWRRAHPEYRARERARLATRPTTGHHSPTEVRPSRAIPEVPILFPTLVRGSRISFWNDELRMDLVQERALAVLEGRDPDVAAREYQARETNWWVRTIALVEETTEDTLRTLVPTV